MKTKKSIPQSRTGSQQERANELNQILKRLSDFYKIPTTKIVNHLYEKFNYGYRDVSKILGVHEQTVKDLYPKNKEVSS